MAEAEPRRSRSSKRASKKKEKKSKSRGKWKKAKSGWYQKTGAKKRTLPTIPEEQELEEDIDDPKSSSSSASRRSTPKRSRSRSRSETRPKSISKSKSKSKSKSRSKSKSKSRSRSSSKSKSMSRSRSRSRSRSKSRSSRSRSGSEAMGAQGGGGGGGGGGPWTESETDSEFESDGDSTLPYEMSGGTPTGPMVKQFLSMRGYAIGSHIKDGGYSSVFAATFKQKTETVQMAVKVLDLENLVMNHSNYVENRLRTELDFMKSADHPNIVKTYRVFEPADLYDQRVYIFMERMDSDLAIILSMKRAPLEEEVAKCYFRQVFQALEYMHALGLAHLDIKPENILIDKSRKVAKLTDFGHIKQLYQMGPNEWMTSKEGGGTAGYTAPEKELGDTEHKPMKCDIWSVGATIFKVLTLRFPFPDIDPAKRVEAAKSQPQYTADEGHVSGPAKNLIQRLLIFNPDQRLTPTEYLLDPWFQEN